MVYPDIKLIKQRMDRFVDRRGPNDCWPWTAYCTPNGYGYISINSQSYYAHRLAYLVKNGKIDDDLEVMHLCDNPSCCNPSHLLQGTHKQNMDQRDQRLRVAHGIRHYTARNPWATVVEARALYAAGIKPSEIGRRLGISRWLANSYGKGRTRRIA